MSYITYNVVHAPSTLVELESCPTLLLCAESDLPDISGVLHLPSPCMP